MSGKESKNEFRCKCCGENLLREKMYYSNISDDGMPMCVCCHAEEFIGAAENMGDWPS